MQDGKSDEVVTIIEDAALEFYNKLRALNLNDHYMASGYASLIRVLMDTVSQNTNPHIAVKLVMVVLERFCEDKPDINLLVHEQTVPPRGKMS